MTLQAKAHSLPSCPKLPPEMWAMQKPGQPKKEGSKERRTLAGSQRGLGVVRYRHSVPRFDRDPGGSKNSLLLPEALAETTLCPIHRVLDLVMDLVADPASFLPSSSLSAGTLQTVCSLFGPLSQVGLSGRSRSFCKNWSISAISWLPVTHQALF